MEDKKNINWGLLKEDRKMVFKIPVGNISKEEAEKTLLELMKIYKEDIEIDGKSLLILPNNESPVN